MLTLLVDVACENVVCAEGGDRRKRAASALGLGVRGGGGGATVDDAMLPLLALVLGLTLLSATRLMELLPGSVEAKLLAADMP